MAIKKLNSNEIEILASTYNGLNWLEENITPNMGTLADSAFGGIPALKAIITEILVTQGTIKD